MKKFSEKLKESNIFLLFVTELIVLFLFVIQYQIWNKNFCVPYFTNGDDSWRNTVFGNVVNGHKWFLAENEQFPFGGMNIIPNEGYFNFYIQILSVKLFRNIGYVSWFFIYLTYFFTALFTFFSLRIHKIGKVSSMIGAILYDFLPYHFYRIGHWNILPYYVVPVILSMCLLLAKNTIEGRDYLLYTKQEKKWVFFSIAMSLVLGMSSIYYSVFIVFCVCVSLFICLINRKKVAIFISFASIFLIIIGMLVSVIIGKIYHNIATNMQDIVLPNISTPTSALSLSSRSLWDIAAYQLSVVDLFLPFRSNIPVIEKIAKNIHWNSVSALEDNHMSLLCLPLSASLILSVLYLFKKDKKDTLLVLCSKFILILIFFSTTLGLSLFLGLINTGIRSYNRMSIFIAFFLVVFLFLFVETYFGKNKKLLYIVSVFILVTGLLTEISPKDGKYMSVDVYNWYVYCGEYTEAEETYNECKTISVGIETLKADSKVAFLNTGDSNNILIESLSKNLYFNLPKNNEEYGRFWKKLGDLPPIDYLESIEYLGYDFLIVNKSAENEAEFSKLLGLPVLDTKNMKVFTLNNAENITIDEAKERFYELYGKLLSE